MEPPPSGEQAITRTLEHFHNGSNTRTSTHTLDVAPQRPASQPLASSTEIQSITHSVFLAPETASTAIPTSQVDYARLLEQQRIAASRHMQLSQQPSLTNHLGTTSPITAIFGTAALHGAHTNTNFPRTSIATTAVPQTSTFAVNTHTTSALFSPRIMV